MLTLLDDEDENPKTGNEVVQNIIKKTETEQDTRKNLLFASEYSDEELSSD